MLVVIGNVNLDTKTAPLPPDPRLFRDGETTAAEIHETIGGGGANTAVATARLGGEVTLVGAVGADELGARLSSYLEACGVRARLVTKPAPTGRSLALTWEGHQRHFVSCLPSSALLATEDVDVPALAAAGCRVLHRADVWFAPALLAAGNRAWFVQARELGLRTSLDLNWDPLWHAGRDDPAVVARIDQVTALLPHTTYVHGNQRELTFFAGQSDLDAAAAWYFAHGAQTLLVHLGAAGSAALSADGTALHAPAEPVARIDCEVGSGDVFTAAFLLREGTPMAARLAECNAVAARHLAGGSELLPRV